MENAHPCTSEAHGKSLIHSNLPVRTKLPIRSRAAPCHEVQLFIFSDSNEVGKLTLELENAIYSEGLTGFPLIVSVRAEGSLQLVPSYRLALLQGLVNHTFILARIFLPNIERMKPQERKSWCSDAVANYFKHWVMPEQFDADTDDPRVATALVLLMAYRARYRLLEGPSLTAYMLKNPPPERARDLSRQSKSKVRDAEPTEHIEASN